MQVGVGHFQRMVGQTALAFSAACCGIVCYLALFPGFYYMQWIGLLVLLWITVSVAMICCSLILSIASRRSSSSSPTDASDLGYIAGMLVLTSLLVGFKVPLHASFLLARPGLEEALAEHRDDLSDVGRVSHDFGLYQIKSAERRCHVDDRIYFMFRDDGEAAIIHSPSGIDDLCYNSGNKGHLFGEWYWMKED